jgi:hypothetical protein
MPDFQATIVKKTFSRLTRPRAPGLRRNPAICFFSFKKRRIFFQIT